MSAYALARLVVRTVRRSRPPTPGEVAAATAFVAMVYATLSWCITHPPHGDPALVDAVQAATGEAQRLLRGALAGYIDAATGHGTR